MTSPYYKYGLDLQSNGRVPILLTGITGGMQAASTERSAHQPMEPPGDRLQRRSRSAPSVSPYAAIPTVTAALIGARGDYNAVFISDWILNPVSGRLYSRTSSSKHL